MAAQETSGWVGTDQGAVHVPEDMGEGFFEGALSPMRGTACRLILFTGGLGAVLLDEATQTSEAFGALIPGQLADLLRLFVGGEHTVEQAEVVTGSTSWPRDMS